MAAEDIFGTIVTLLVGAILLLAITGSDPSFLLDIAPQVVILAFVLAFSVAVLRAVVH